MELHEAFTHLTGRIPCELLHSLLGERSESVVSRYSKCSEEGTEGNIFYAFRVLFEGELLLHATVETMEGYY